MRKIEPGKYEAVINGRTYTAIRNGNEPAGSAIAWMLLRDGVFADEFRTLTEIKQRLFLSQRRAA